MCGASDRDYSCTGHKSSHEPLRHPADQPLSILCRLFAGRVHLISLPWLHTSAHSCSIDHINSFVVCFLSVTALFLLHVYASMLNVDILTYTCDTFISMRIMLCCALLHRCRCLHSSHDCIQKQQTYTISVSMCSYLSALCVM